MELSRLSIYGPPYKDVPDKHAELMKEMCDDHVDLITIDDCLGAKVDPNLTGPEYDDNTGRTKIVLLIGTVLD